MGRGGAGGLLEMMAALVVRADAAVNSPSSAPMSLHLLWPVTGPALSLSLSLDGLAHKQMTIVKDLTVRERARGNFTPGLSVRAGTSRTLELQAPSSLIASHRTRQFGVGLAR